VNGRGLVIAPPSAANSPWLRKFGEISTAFASGWMQVRGIRRRRAADRGFALSDHADWNGLLSTIRATGASTVAVTHGYVSELVRYLKEQGLNSFALATRFTGESDEAQQETASDTDDGTRHPTSSFPGSTDTLRSGAS